MPSVGFLRLSLLPFAQSPRGYETKPCSTSYVMSIITSVLFFTSVLVYCAKPVPRTQVERVMFRRMCSSNVVYERCDRQVLSISESNTMAEDLVMAELRVFKERLLRPGFIRRATSSSPSNLTVTFCAAGDLSGQAFSVGIVLRMMRSWNRTQTVCGTDVMGAS